MLRRECRVFGFELRGGEEFCDESFGVGVRAIVGEAIEFIQLRGKAHPKSMGPIHTRPVCRLGGSPSYFYKMRAQQRGL